MRQSGLFGLSDHMKRLSADGDSLEVLARVVDFEVFRPPLAAALVYLDGTKGGRSPYDPVTMLKVLVLAAQNNVSDARMEYLIRDRLSWLRFLGFDLGAATPDVNTIRMFRERLSAARALDTLFADFDRQLKERGYLSMGGQIIDATLIAAPKQRNAEAEKAAVKGGQERRRDLAERARQGPPEGRRCALDAEVRQGPANRRRQAAGGHCDPELWLQEHDLDLPDVRLHP